MLSLDGTFIQTFGEGEKIVVIHGGPGFSHDYLVSHLSFLSEEHQIIHFDQYGCGKTVAPSESLTFNLIAAHAADVLSYFQSNNEIRVIAHSFGVAVLLSALSQLPKLQVSGMILNAVPTNKFRFDSMRNELFQRMGPDIVASLPAAAQTGLDQQQISDLLKFYISPDSAPDLAGFTFDFLTYNLVYETLNHFDVSDSVFRLGQCDLVLGTDDFIRPNLISDIAASCKSTTTLNSAGHFSFAEQPEAFRAVAHKIFDGR